MNIIYSENNMRLPYIHIKRDCRIIKYLKNATYTWHYTTLYIYSCANDDTPISYSSKSVDHKTLEYIYSSITFETGLVAC